MFEDYKTIAKLNEAWRDAIDLVTLKMKRGEITLEQAVERYKPIDSAYRIRTQILYEQQRAVGATPSQIFTASWSYE